MAKLMFTVLVLTAITVQAEVRSDGGPRRIPRSPSPENPPPPVFHTHQWSGFEQSSDGKQAGVFSGAAAAADGGSHTSGQAFSIASAASGDNGPVLGTGSQVKVGQSGQPDKLESRFGGDDRLFDSSQGQFQSGYHGHSGGYNGGQFGYQGQSGVKGGYHEVGGFRQSPNSYQQGGHDNFAKGGCCGGYGGGSFAQSQAQAHSSSGSGYGGSYRGLDDPGRITFGGQPSALGTGYGGSQNSHGSSGYYGVNQGFASNANSRANADSNTFGNSGYGQGYGSGQGYDRLQGFNGQNQNAEAASNAGASAGSNSIGQGYIPSQGYNGGQQSYNLEHQGYNSDHQGYNSGHEGYNSEHQGYNKGHSALKGALDLASQGLQSQSNPGCSTCGKSNYALSNAKSHSGDAVAVSVGG